MDLTAATREFAWAYADATTASAYDADLLAADLIADPARLADLAAEAILDLTVADLTDPAYTTTAMLTILAAR